MHIWICCEKQLVILKSDGLTSVWGSVSPVSSLLHHMCECKLSTWPTRPTSTWSPPVLPPDCWMPHHPPEYTHAESYSLSIIKKQQCFTFQTASSKSYSLLLVEHILLFTVLFWGEREYYISLDNQILRKPKNKDSHMSDLEISTVSGSLHNWNNVNCASVSSWDELTQPRN